MATIGLARGTDGNVVAHVASAARGQVVDSLLTDDFRGEVSFHPANPVRYVAAHKVDRLARNRADDVAINLALQQAGVELVSVSENIDQTPSGLLLHGIMSSIAEFYSRNLANEVIKGTTQKAKNGGTPTKAPTGYLNVRKIENGREIRTVEIDPERGPLMAWAFQQYATGNWTIRTLLAELTAKGLTTSPNARRSGKPLEISHLHRLLRNPYYIGLVRYCGVTYPGKHEGLAAENVWQEVQKILSAKDLAGERQREHPHYLRGSIYCGQCGARLIICNAKGNGGTYPYFICIGRQRDKNSCKQRAIPVHQAERAVEEHFATVQLPQPEVDRLRAYLTHELAEVRADSDREQAVQQRRLQKLERERKKLLDAHYADAIPLDLLKTEQARIADENAEIQRRLDAVSGDFKTAEANLQRALIRAGDASKPTQQHPTSYAASSTSRSSSASFSATKGASLASSPSPSKPFSAKTSAAPSSPERKNNNATRSATFAAKGPSVPQPGMPSVPAGEHRTAATVIRDAVLVRRF